MVRLLFLAALLYSNEGAMARHDVKTELTIGCINCWNDESVTRTKLFPLWADCMNRFCIDAYDDR